MYPQLLHAADAAVKDNRELCCFCLQGVNARLVSWLHSYAKARGTDRPATYLKALPSDSSRTWHGTARYAEP
jgi:hypothetical protein